MKGKFEQKWIFVIMVDWVCSLTLDSSIAERHRSKQSIIQLKIWKRNCICLLTHQTISRNWGFYLTIHCKGDVNHIYTLVRRLLKKCISSLFPSDSIKVGNTYHTDVATDSNYGNIYFDIVFSDSKFTDELYWSEYKYVQVWIHGTYQRLIA